MIAATLFLACFSLGLLMTAGSLFGGHLHLGHFHFGHHGGHAGRAGTGQWLNGFSMAGFFCWFGGVGFLLQRAHSFAMLVIVLLALAAGSAGAAVISLFLTRVLMRSERPLVPEDTEMRGVLGRVSTRVRAGGVGEIVFSLNGTRRCCAARSREARTLTQGTEVVVLTYDRGVAWVAAFDPEARDLAPAHDIA